MERTSQALGPKRRTSPEISGNLTELYIGTYDQIQALRSKVKTFS